MITTFLAYYKKLGLEDWLGLTTREVMAKMVAESFVRRAFNPGYEEAVAALLDPLDEESRAVVRKVIDRHHYIYTNNLLQHRKMYDATELANRRILRRELPPLAAKIGIPPHLTEPSVLYYHHGLRHTTLPAGLAAKFEGRDVIDVGAAIGDSAYIFDTHYQPRRIHSFEPRASRIPVLKQFAERHNLSRVTLVPSALGPTKGHLEDGAPMVALDSYVEDNKLDVGLVKMDVDGAEEMVLEGARNVLREQKPLLVVSMYHNGQQFFDLLPLIRSIQPQYQFAVRKIDDLSPVYETTLFCY